MFTGTGCPECHPPVSDGSTVYGGGMGDLGMQTLTLMLLSKGKWKVPDEQESLNCTCMEAKYIFSLGRGINGDIFLGVGVGMGGKDLYFPL